jgi:hypothetical protein
MNNAFLSSKDTYDLEHTRFCCRKVLQKRKKKRQPFSGGINQKSRNSKLANSRAEYFPGLSSAVLFQWRWFHLAGNMSP